MTLKLNNTATKSVSDFQPIEQGKVSLYTCGPTVYDSPHIGNWAAYIYWDILVRVLIANGYDVTRVMNITDVGHLTSDADDGEDKLEKGARREGKTAWEVAEHYSEEFMQGMEQLGLILPEHVARATDFIPQQLELVRVLKEKGYTYQTSDGLYFDTAKFEHYADFARLNLGEQKEGARVELNTEKRNPSDFALWKFTPAGQTRDMEWETPSDLIDLPGDSALMGFPGWHLECSAIAMSILGPSIDIHTGGIDHIPIHHTNEIAQSEAASDVTFAHTWLHNNHLKIEGVKISKSLNNGYTLSSLAEHDFSPLDYRMFVLQSHYSTEGNFTFDNLAAAATRLKNWRNYAALRHQTHDRLEHDKTKHDEASSSLMRGASALLNALNNNLDTPGAFKIIDESFARLDNQKLSDIHHHGLTYFIETIDELLGLQLAASTPDISDANKRLLLKRTRAREQKDWKESDRLRDELSSAGIGINDSASESIWYYL